MTAPAYKPRIMETLGSSKPPRGESQRMDRLVEMDARRERYVNEGNASALMALADEYEHLGRYGCPMTAARIRKQADGM